VNIYKKMQTFQLYHLNHSDITHVELKKRLLSSNRPLDESIVKTYSNSRQHELHIRDNFSEVDKHDFLKEKCHIARTLLDKDGYIYVADLKANNVFEVITRTNSINGYWFMKKLKNVVFKALSERDTRSYDVITCDEGRFLVNGVGVIDIDKEVIFNINNEP